MFTKHQCCFTTCVVNQSLTESTWVRVQVPSISKDKMDGHAQVTETIVLDQAGEKSGGSEAMRPRVDQ